ncbi:MAG: hypothetical protein WAT36_07370, partial [Chromatiaceae bacterium]
MLAPVLAEIDRLAVQRAATQAQRAVEARDGADLYVCRADSLRAGNCPAGTDAWLRERGLDAGKHAAGHGE